MCLLHKKIETLVNKTSIYDLFFNALNWKGERISNLDVDIQLYDLHGVIPVYVEQYVNENCADDLYPAIVKGG
jgi:hypothetical protein